jgi:enoyl-[acyl-carrier protein] reductase II
MKLDEERAPLDEYEKLGAGALKRAVIDGDMDYGSIMAGQIAAMVNKEESCKDIIMDLITQANKLLGKSKD